MSAHRVHRLICDHDGCITIFDDGAARADLTRQIAAVSGWVHGVVPPVHGRRGPAMSLDYCPAHASDLGDLKPKTLHVHARSS